jgi:hypothetical protein
VAMEATARSLGEDDSDYEKAISWMERAVKTLREQCGGTPLEVDGYLLTHISKWKMSLGDVAAAHEIAYEYVKSLASLPHIQG